MKKPCLILSSLFLVFMLLPVSSFAFEIGARGYYYLPSLNGDVQVDDSGIAGTKISFSGDLGIDDDNYPSIEVFAGVGSHHFSLAYTNIDYSGQNTLERQIIFNGRTYNVNDQVSSSISYDMIDIAYQYDLLDLENILAGFSFGAVLQAKYIDGEVSLNAAGVNEKEEFTLPIPMVGINFHLGILANILEARLRGVAMKYSGNNIYELMADISWTPLPFIDIHGGLKRFAVDIDEDDVILDYNISGPYAAVTISF